ncbi:MAG: hypothetical protein ABR613_12555, partial [Actinomycetota bacterium]
MRLYRYASSSGGFEPRLAIATDGAPVDLLKAWDDVTGTRLAPETAQFLVSTAVLIERGPELWTEVRDVARAAASLPDLLVPESERGFRWLCPMDRVASLKDFLAFEDHVKRGAQRRGIDVPDYWYEAPVYYKGNHRAVIGPDATCP